MSLAAALFDLDGTLIDTAADFVATLNILCARHNIPPPAPRDIRNTVSDGARALVSLAFELDESSPRFSDLRQALLDIYEQELGRNATLFDAVKPSLAWLEAEQIPWGIVTNKPRLYTELLLQRMQLSPAIVVCPDDVSQTKPHAEPLLLACKQLNVAPQHCVYAGDHPRDIEAGNNAAMQTLACQWGYIADGININTWQADINLATADDLLQALQHFRVSP